MYFFRREKQSVISETYGNNMRMRVTHQFEIRLIIGIIGTVTEAYESHRKSPISPIAFIAFKFLISYYGQSLSQL